MTETTTIVTYHLQYEHHADCEPAWARYHSTYDTLAEARAALEIISDDAEIRAAKEKRMGGAYTTGRYRVVERTSHVTERQTSLITKTRAYPEENKRVDAA
jgi:hypothetical protein